MINNIYFKLINSTKKIHFLRTSKKIIYLLFGILLTILSRLFFLRKKITLIQCHDSEAFCDNTRFLYEHLSEKKNNEFFWITKSKKISNYLKYKNFNYININENVFKYIWVILRTKTVIDNGSNFFNPFFLFSLDKKIIKITTSHGFGPKTVPFSKEDSREKDDEIKSHQEFDYINFSSQFIKNKFVQNYKLKLENSVVLGMPRCDQLLLNNKKGNLFHYLTQKNKINSKIILYTPTWRPYPYFFPLNQLSGMNYEDFNCFLTKHNIYFFYSFHSNQKYEKLTSNFSRIVDINHKKFPFYDTTTFLKEVDILLNDYSTTSTDFCLTGKPQIFFTPDFNKYEKFKGFLEDYKKNLIGPEIKNYTNLKKLILKNLKDKKMYLKQYRFKIKLYKEKYCDISRKFSSKNFSNFLKSL
jgi:CDP-glycerol glycerophosphotransferase